MVSATSSDCSLRSTASGHRILAADQFVLEEQLGTGSFGTVYRAIDTVVGRICAVKKIDMETSDDDIEEIQREISILAECNDEHITRYYGSFVHGYKLWIIMEYLGGGSCLDLLKAAGGMPEPAIAHVLKQLLLGLSYLHTNGKIHRDIKAANILVADDGAVKIADFGVAAQLSNNLSRRNTFVGTPFWMAPEVIGQEDYTFSADVWSLGITAMELALGEPPLSHLHPMKVLFYIPKNRPPALDAKFSAEFRDFVAQCLRKSPAERSSVSALLQHKFLQKASRPELVTLVHEYKSLALPPPKKPIAATMLPSDAELSQEDDDDWDFDTVRAPMGAGSGATLGSTLGSTVAAVGAAAKFAADAGDRSALASAIAPKIPSRVPSPQSDAPSLTPSLAPTIAAAGSASSASQYDTISSIQDTMRDRRSPLVRIFSHAAHKYKDPTLGEVADILTVEPLTLEVESYLIKKIGHVAVDKHDIRPRDKGKRLDAVEDILLTKWLDEARKRH